MQCNYMLKRTLEQIYALYEINMVVYETTSILTQGIISLIIPCMSRSHYYCMPQLGRVLIGFV